MEKAIIKGLVKIVWKGFYINSLYNKEGWQTALDAIM